MAEIAAEMSENAAPAEDAGAAFAAVVEDDGPDELAPLTPADTPAKRGGSRRQKLTERQRKDRRNEKLKQKRRAAKALSAAEAALGIKPEGDAQGDKRTHADVVTDIGRLRADEQKMLNAEIPPEQLATLLGLACDVTARTIPVKWGGGPLTAAERELLGSVWAAAAAPYLKGEASVVGIALISTVQVFALRAMTRKPDEDEPAQPTPPQPMKGTAADAAAKPAASSPPPPGKPTAAARRNSVMPDAKVKRVPSVIND